MKIPYLLLSAIGLSLPALFFWLPTTAEPEVPRELMLYQPTASDSDLRFIANEGQWEPIIRYKIKLNGGQVYLEDQGLTYHFVQPPLSKHPHQRTFGELDQWQAHALKVKFLNANPQPNLRPELKFSTYHNYFLGNDPDKWAGGVPLYGMITYEELYPDIDLRFYGYGDAMKYDFIVKAGADPSRIALDFQGADRIFLRNQELHIRTSIRGLTEEKPFVFQVIDGQQVEIPCEYRLKGTRLTYHFPQGYDNRYDLVIDPTLIFSTYSGSQSDNWGYTATYDVVGNAYAGGIEWNGGNQYPTTPGAIQGSSNLGEREVTISKFDPAGVNLLYATYMGGDSADQPHSLVVNSDTQLVVMGRTRSLNFPVTFNAFDQTHNGARDIFVSVFSADGTNLIGSTYLGGNQDDGVNVDIDFSVYGTTKFNYGDDARGEVIVDGQNNIYVTAPTRSANFPVSPGAYQTLIGGAQDGTITKFNPNLSTRIWSTYFGRAGNDASYSLKLDDQNNIYFAGGSSSANLPTVAPAEMLTFQGGDTDGFVGKLSANGANLMACTYLGTPFYDQVYLLELDDDNNVYVTGQTIGNWPIVSPLAGTVYQNPNSRQFISKLEPDLSEFIYSTTFGSPNTQNPNISPTAFLVDRCENVYVTGWGGTVNNSSNPSTGFTNNMPVTSDAIQATTDGSDMYLIVFSKDAQSLLYATFLGGNGTTFSGEHLDGGTCRFDKEGVVYHAVCSQCGNPGTPFPTTPGVYSPNTGFPDNCNLAVFKMAFDLAGVEAEFITRDQNGQVVSQSEGCAPFTVNFDNESTPGDPTQTTYLWDFGDNGITSFQTNPTYTYQNPGTYDISLVIFDPTSCNLADTAWGTIVVHPPPDVEAGPDQTVCPGDTFLLTSLLTAEHYQWGPSSLILGSDTVANPTGVVFQTTNFSLTVTDTNGCEATDLTTITVNNFQVQARSDTLICRGGSSPLGATSNGGVSYNWFSRPATNISNANSQFATASNVDTTTVFYVQAIDAIGCEALDSFTIEVFEVFTLQDTFVCDGGSIVLSSQGGVSFDWSPKDGTLSNPNTSSPIASPLTTTTYTVTATSAEGCISTKSVEVSVQELPQPTIEGVDPICIGESLTLRASGGQAYNWLPNTDIVDGNTNQPTVNPNTTTTYTLTVTDALGCENSTSVDIVVNPLPDIVVGPLGATVCEGDQVQLFASGAVSYIWSPATDLNNAFSANPTANPSAGNTTYTVTGTDANGCENTAQTLVVTTLRPRTEIEGDNFLCVGGEIELTAFGGDYYVWSTGDTAQSISLTPSGTLTVYATAYVGECAGFRDSITIDVRFEYPEASFDFSPEEGWAPAYIQFNNTSIGAIDYLWDFGFGLDSKDMNPLHIYPSAGTYPIMLIAFSGQGCPDTAYSEIVIENVALHAPSGFSPNGDDHNDFYLVGYYGIKSLQVEIYSRWGMKIYESDNLDFRWDGTYQGQPVPEGVYVYKIEGIGENDLPYRRNGTVTLIR
jgi:gliding motility-associated-like protein